MQSRIFIFALVIAAVSASAWDDYNDPAAFGEKYNYVLGALPTQATLPVIPWTDNYWPSSDSGLAFRWNARHPENFKYKLLTEVELKNATAETIMSLSPAEKYDIYMGRFDYPIVRSEWLRTHPTDADWEGLCHGWAPAAGFYTEPAPFSVKTAQGINLQFGSADMKGLLTYFNAEYIHSNAYFLSQRCEYDLRRQPNMGETAECADMHAAALHLVLTNQIAMNKFFVADVDRGYAVWNQPVFKYSYVIEEYRNATNGSAPGTVKEAKLQTIMTYSRESQQQWAKHGDYPVTYSKKYEYWLELDTNNTIIGGTWLSNERSDFAWKNNKVPFSGYFKGLTHLYALSINETVPAVNATGLAMTSFLTKVNHRVHTNRVGSISVSNYGPSHSQSWVIAPAKAKSITLTFPSFSTTKFFDKMKIYEGAEGHGPLVAVLHGQRVPKSLKLDVSSVFVTFESDRQTSGAGFRVNYKAN